MYYSPTELKWLHCRICAKNRCPVKEANQISLIYLVPKNLLDIACSTLSYGWGRLVLNGYLFLALKVAWSVYKTLHIIYRGLTNLSYQVWYICGFEALYYSLSYVHFCFLNLFIFNVPILDIEDQNTTYVFAYKGTPGYVLELQFSITSRCSTNSKSAFEIRLILDRVTFDKIGFERKCVLQNSNTC